MPMSEHDKWRDKFDPYFKLMPQISTTMPLEQALFIACDTVCAHNVDKASIRIAQEIWSLQAKLEVPCTEATFNGVKKSRYNSDPDAEMTLPRALWFALDIVPMAAVDCAAKVLVRKLRELQLEAGVEITKAKL